MRERTYLVTVSIPVSLAFDPGEESPMEEPLRVMLLENLVQHPAMSNAGDLSMFVDSIEEIR